jgi:hypothetical protein
MDWYPTDTEASTNGGHICIGANVYDLGGDGSLLMPGGSLDLNDPHTAQRNIGIIAVAAAHGGGGDGAQPRAGANFFLPPADGFPLGTLEETVLRLEPITPDKVLSPVVREQLLSVGAAALVGGDPAPETRQIAAGLAVGLDELLHKLVEPIERMLLRGGGELCPPDTEIPVFPSEQPVKEVILNDTPFLDGPQPATATPRKALPFSLDFVFPSEPPGAVHEFDVIQETKDGRLLGGIRIVTLSTPGGALG